MEASQLICSKVVAKQVQEVQMPLQSEVAPASHPKKAIMEEMKWWASVKTRKPYKTTKHNEASHTSINWQSPTFWPIVEMVAHQQVGKPNLTKLVDQL